MTSDTTNTVILDERFVYGIPLDKLPSYRKAEPVGDKPTVKHEGINYDLLEEIMTFIEEHPLTWRQASWFSVVDQETGDRKYDLRIEEVIEKNSCGTSFCFAGHVGIHEGFPTPPLLDEEEWDRLVVDEDGYEHFEHVESFAQKRLGLRGEQASALFDGDNSMADLRNMVTILKIYPGADSYQLRDVRDEFEETVATEAELREFLGVPAAA